MKALTICQPFAELIARGEKRVENRTWSVPYRGLLLIHAGKSRQWLEGQNHGVPKSSMTLGAIVAVATLADCVQLGTGTLTIGAMIVNGVELMRPGTTVIKSVSEAARRRWPWLESHEHTHGPWCWVLTDVRRFKTPLAYRGAQGLFTVPDQLVLAAVREATSDSA